MHGSYEDHSHIAICMISKLPAAISSEPLVAPATAWFVDGPDREADRASTAIPVRSRRSNTGNYLLATAPSPATTPMPGCAVKKVARRLIILPLARLTRRRAAVLRVAHARHALAAG